VKFSFGKPKRTIQQYAVVGIVLSIIVATLSKCTHIPEANIWDGIDEIQRHVKPGSMLNDFFISSPAKLKRRVSRDVDKAISDVTPEYDRIINNYNKRYQPIYKKLPTNKSTCYTKECLTLAPPMEICAPWWDQCNSN